MGGRYLEHEGSYRLGDIRLPVETEYCFGRHIWGPLPYRDPLELWDRLASRLPSEGFERVRSELGNGLRNLELAYAHWARERLPPIAELAGVDPVFFEKLTLSGHNLHVGAKTRSNFSADDSMRYAAELGGQFEIGFVGVRQDYVERSGEPFERYFEVELPAGYRPIPVHPFQRRNVLKPLYAREWEAGLLVDSPTRLAARACTSLRTVHP
ncbi:MAG: IucA/IucC family protein, partial [Acidobacteriota bacterium]